MTDFENMVTAYRGQVLRATGKEIGRMTATAELTRLLGRVASESKDSQEFVKQVTGNRND